MHWQLALPAKTKSRFTWEELG